MSPILFLVHLFLVSFAFLFSLFNKNNNFSKMSAKNKELAEEDVLNMTCDKLRKELKKKRASTAGKKSELQSRLLEV